MSLDELKKIVALDIATGVVIVFAKSVGCVPCQRLKPHIDIVKDKLTNIDFYEINLDLCEREIFEYALSELSIQSTPTVMYFTESGPKIIQSRTAPLLIKELSNG